MIKKLCVILIFLINYSLSEQQITYSILNTTHCSNKLYTECTALSKLTRDKYEFSAPVVQNFLNIPFPEIIMDINFVSDKCKSAVKELWKALYKNELWALKLMDATAKLPSGLLNGNINQYGDYDECLSVPQAQYCLAEINFEGVRKKPYSTYRNLVHSHFSFRGEFKDPQHRVPDFNVVKWGICFPSNCSQRDLEISAKKQLNVELRIRPSLCKQAKMLPRKWSLGDYLSRLILGSIILLVLVSTTLYRADHLEKNKSKLLSIVMAFALQTNAKQLFQITSQENRFDNTDNKKQKIVKSEVRALDGIRALSAISLLMCHKSVALLYNPYINRTVTIENLGMAWTVIARTAIIYTDSFLLISGFLTARSFVTDLDKYKRINFKEKIINRVVRMTPNISAVILFCTYILPDMSYGPLWPDVIVYHSTLCKKNMWKNMLYIHNYFGFENMCLTHTHQVGIDMQLFLFAPILVYLCWKNLKIGLIVASSIATLSTILRYWITYKNNLSHVVYFGITVQQMFETANLSYILPTHRATIYIMGILLAFISSNYKPNLSKISVAFLWIAALSLGFLAMLGPYHMARLGYTYQKADAAIFGAFSPIAWGLSLAWIIYASNHGYGGFFGDILSWKGFTLFSKIAYSFYLVQFPIIFYFVGTQRNPTEFKPFVLLEYSETTIIVIFSLLLTMFVEMPFQKLLNIFKKRG